MLSFLGPVLVDASLLGGGQISKYFFIAFVESAVSSSVYNIFGVPPIFTNPSIIPAATAPYPFVLIGVTVIYFENTSIINNPTLNL